MGKAGCVPCVAQMDHGGTIGLETGKSRNLGLPLANGIILENSRYLWETKVPHGKLHLEILPQFL